MSGDFDMSTNTEVNVDVNTETWERSHFTAESRDVVHLFPDLDTTWLK